MSDNVKYASIRTREKDGQERAYHVGPSVKSIERVPGELVFTVTYVDGTAERHPSTEIVNFEYTPEEKLRYGL